LSSNTFRIQSRDVKQYKKIFFRFFKTDLSKENDADIKDSRFTQCYVKKNAGLRSFYDQFLFQDRLK